MAISNSDEYAQYVNLSTDNIPKSVMANKSRDGAVL